MNPRVATHTKVPPESPPDARPSAPPSANRQIARAALTVMLAYIFSQLVGLVAKVLTARSFGTGAGSEAFFAANRFSEILFNLVAGGALGSAFIPTFSTLLAQGERRRAWELASAISNWVVIVLSALAALAAAFAPWVVENILAPGFTDPQLLALTANLLRVQLPSAVIFGLSGLLMGVLNSHQSFLWPALAPSMYQLGWIFGLIFLAPRFGVYGLAWGVVIGSLAHLVVQLPILLRLPERRYRPTLGLRVPQVSEVGRLMAPRLLGVAAVQLNFLVNTRIASTLSPGSLSAISLAFPLMLMPEAAIAQSVATAALPTFSAQVARGEEQEMRHSLATSLRWVLLLAIPAMVGLILLRQPVVALLYQHGAFDALSTQMTAWALLWYGLGLVSHSLVEVLSRAFYALHDTRTPVTVAVIAMGINILLSYALAALFSSLGVLPLGGIALANTVATTLEMSTLLVLMHRRLQGLEGNSILTAVGQACLGTLVMGLFLGVWLGFLGNGGLVPLVLGGVVLGAALYAFALVAFNVREAQAVWLRLLKALPQLALRR
jgi:putative peptidoglycan lipid II flippase